MKFITLSDDSGKMIIGICLTIFMLILYHYNKIYVLYLIVFSIPLPIYIRFMQRDAATLTTLLIVLFFMLELVSGNIKVNCLNKFTLMFFTLFFIVNTVSLFNLHGDELMVNARHYLSFVSSLMLFLILMNLVVDTKTYNTLLLIVGISIMIQVIISFLIIVNIKLSIFKIFTSRTSEFLTTSARPGGIIDDYELLAEWFAIFFPYAIWIAYVSKTRVWGIVLIALLIAGIVITKTRGAIISLCIGMVFFIIFFQNKYIFKKIGFAIVVGFVFIMGWIGVRLIMPTWYENIASRFNLAIETYQEGGSFMEVVNRQDIWKNFFDKYYIMKFFGTGKRFPGGEEGSFHSLYLTLFYQTGILGFLVFSGFLITIIIQLIYTIFKKNKTSHTMLVTLSLSSIIIFIIDEIKIEYLRAAFFSQFAWLLFGVVLLSTIIKDDKQSV